MEAQEKKQIINEVYQALKNREIHPTGTFDEKKRWYAVNADLIDVREPSKRYPFSELVACRTKKYVTAVFNKFKPKNVEELLKKV